MERRIKHQSSVTPLMSSSHSHQAVYLFTTIVCSGNVSVIISYETRNSSPAKNAILHPRVSTFSVIPAVIIKAFSIHTCRLSFHEVLILCRTSDWLGKPYLPHFPLLLIMNNYKHKISVRQVRSWAHILSSQLYYLIIILISIYLFRFYPTCPLMYFCDAEL